ncbi:hypothetical protein GGR51DRAFT_534065 [Nemania sp. FL0031]|nr:hypothetical protein GGR51DRAFT_534065 [Nemania sp. FL0031]
MCLPSRRIPTFVNMVVSPSIEAWIASVQSSAAISAPETSTNNGPAKRQRQTDDDDDDNNNNNNKSVTSSTTTTSPPPAKRRCRKEPDNKALLDSPPLTNSVVPMPPRSVASLRLGKRGSAADDDSDISPGVKRPRAPKPTESEYLRWLEKPVHQIQTTFKASDLPLDVQSLYNDIRSSERRWEKIVPFELRESVEQLSGDPLDITSCLDPCQEKVAEWTAELNILSDIAAQAAVCAQYARHEFGWNIHVHAQVLHHVFNSIPPNTENILDEPEPDGPEPDEPELDELEPDQPKVTARFETVMSASIATNSIPYIIDAGERFPACSVVNTTQSETGTTVQTAKLSGTQKIDFVLVMNIETDRKLHEAIRSASQAKKHKGGHVNQTDYASIRYRPIAVSIETKAELLQSKALVQLGLWVAAGHKRLHQLRNHLFPPPIPLYADEATERPQPRLVTMPLIRIEGHIWNIYFACDMGSFIRLIGPTRLGSTDRIVELYALIKSLRHIKRWIETTFYDGMTTWFMQEAVVPTESADATTQGNAL